MSIRTSIIVILISPLLLSFYPVKDADISPPEEKWISLFNGKNLDGWIIKIAGHDLNDNYKNTYSVEDGIIKVSYDKYEKFDNDFGHLFYKEKFSHYKIRIEYRFTGEQVEGGPEWGLLNSGVMLHCQPPESMRKDQYFPVCVEAQFLGDDGSGKRTTGNVCTPGTHVEMKGELITEHCIQTSSKVCKPDEWVTMEAEVYGDSLIKHFINGELVSEYEKPQYDDTDEDGKKFILKGNNRVTEGYIALQAESHPVEFRKVEILLFDTK